MLKVGLPPGVGKSTPLYLSIKDWEASFRKYGKEGRGISYNPKSKQQNK